MPVERFFSPSELVLNEQVLLKDREFHHLAHAVRIKENEVVELVNGNGVLAIAKVVHLGKKEVILNVLERDFFSPPRMEVILAQAFPRMNRLDCILEKATELGATQIWLFPGLLSERKILSESQLEHAQQIILSAMKQCGRLYLPKMMIKSSLLKWEKVEGPAFFGDVNQDAPLFQQFLNSNKMSHITFLIGPESGFSEEEINHLVALGVKGVKLNSHTLRTDTAAIAALSLITHYL